MTKLLPETIRLKLMAAAKIEDDRVRRIEIDRVIKHAKNIRPDLFKQEDDEWKQKCVDL